MFHVQGQGQNHAPALGQDLALEQVQNQDPLRLQRGLEQDRQKVAVEVQIDQAPNRIEFFSVFRLFCIGYIGIYK